MAVRDVTALAAKHSLAVIRTCVGAWYMNRKCVGGKLEDRSAGVAVYWLKECAGAPSNVFDDRAWQRTDLYRRHRSAEELEAERSAEGEAAERLTMMDVPPAPEPRRELDPELAPYLDQDRAWLDCDAGDQAASWRVSCVSTTLTACRSTSWLPVTHYGSSGSLPAWSPG